MAKEIITQIKLQVTGGQANPAPPIGPALGQHGVNIMGFCKEFNEKTRDKQGTVIPVVITVYKDKSFTFIMKAPPVAIALKKAAGLAKASGEAGRATLGKVTKEQVLEIVRSKIQDMNTSKIEAACRIVEGTARSMGIEVVK
jgi:large subunit ribosomal protein L11